MRRAAYALINLSYLKNNLAITRKIVSSCKIMAVVKADAYGHGVLQVCKSLSAADAFGVAYISEAMELRESGVGKPVLALQGFNTSKELDLAITNDIQVVIHQSEQLKILQSVSLTKPLDVYVKLDTGMHRLGFEPVLFKQIITEIKSILPAKSNLSVMTHLACTDEVNNSATQQQLAEFDHALVDQYYTQSVANSAGILAWPQSHRDWVRPGLMLYGLNPLQEADGLSMPGKIRPVMSLRAPFISIKICKKGARIGYGGDYCCPRDMVIGVVAAGYADGYPRHLSQAPKCMVHGKLVSIVGRVSMDMITVDLSNVQAKVGDEVELWGEHVSVTDIARDAETISYELLCAAGNAVHRKYVE